MLFMRNPDVFDRRPERLAGAFKLRLQFVREICAGECPRVVARELVGRRLDTKLLLQFALDFPEGIVAAEEAHNEKLLDRSKGCHCAMLVTYAHVCRRRRAPLTPKTAKRQKGR